MVKSVGDANGKYKSKMNSLRSRSKSARMSSHSCKTVKLMFRQPHGPVQKLTYMCPKVQKTCYNTRHVAKTQQEFWGSNKHQRHLSLMFSRRLKVWLYDEVILLSIQTWSRKLNKKQVVPWVDAQSREVTILKMINIKNSNWKFWPHEKLNVSPSGR